MARKQPSFELTRKNGGLLLSFSGPMDQGAYQAYHKKLLHRLSRETSDHLEMDLSGVDSLDDYGALILLGVHRTADKKGFPCDVSGASGQVAETLELLRLRQLCRAPHLEKPRRPNPITSLGEWGLRLVSEAAFSIRFTGQLALAWLWAWAHPWRVRWEDTIYSMRRVGVDAVPIVGLINFLLGFIIAFMSSVELSRYGAGIYVASLVSLAMTRELGPIMTAVVVSGRSGSAFASEIGTMKVSEEIDALSVMGFDPVLFLAVPKLIASVTMVPLLTLFASLFGIIGGLVVGLFFLDLTFENYMRQTLEILDLRDILWAVFKGAWFGMLIAWIGSLRGFQVRGGAVSVGEATTRAVVGGVFLVIFWDSVFAFIQLYYMD
ncbi:MAG: MlaE family lipid ABC transporter permease subunit [Deltaproteobacteria bacterium]|nr:MlaE family lipid ABC transporter permease subunit [Deltaproteobacteria bacterium]